MNSLFNKFDRIDMEMLLVIIFLGIGLILSIVFVLENLASGIIGAFAGYLARTLKTHMTTERSDV